MYIILLGISEYTSLYHLKDVPGVKTNISNMKNLFENNLEYKNVFAAAGKSFLSVVFSTLFFFTFFDRDGGEVSL